MRLLIVVAFLVAAMFPVPCVAAIDVINDVHVDSLSTLTTAPEGLTAVARAFVREGTTPTAFNKYVGHGTPLASVFLEAELPKGYRIYRVHEPDKMFDYAVVLTPRHNSFVIYGAGGYIQGWEPVNQLLPKIEKLLGPALKGYRRREVRNSVVYSAEGQPTVELLVTEGSPSETLQQNYSVRMLIFPPGVTVLTLDAPCEWWTVTPPPDWRKRLNPRDCIAKWTAVPRT